MTGATETVRPSPAETPADAYERDFYAWTLAAAALLRAGRLAELDLENLAEEVESLGQADRRTLASHIQTIIEHLMKLQRSPAADPQAGRADTIDRGREDIERILEDSPNLRRQPPDLLATETNRARRAVARQFARRGEDACRLGGLTYDTDQVLGPWLPD